MNLLNLNVLLGGATIALAVILVRASLVDLRSYRLPDQYVLPLIPMGLGVSAIRLAHWPVEAALGAVAGFGVFYLIGEIFYRLRGIDGLGVGDAKLLAAAGAWVGLWALPLVVLMASVGALAVALIAGQANGRIAFGPYLSGAFFVVWLWVLFQGVPIRP